MVSISGVDCRLYQPGLQKGAWSKEEDQVVRNMVAQVGVVRVRWSTIAEQVCEHTYGIYGIYGIWCCDIGINLIHRHPILCVCALIAIFDTLSPQLPGRIGKQCRERWFNHLDPTIKKGDWSRDEEIIIYEAQRHFGNR